MGLVTSAWLGGFVTLLSERKTIIYTFILLWFHIDQRPLLATHSGSSNKPQKYGTR